MSENLYHVRYDLKVVTQDLILCMCIVLTIITFVCEPVLFCLFLFFVVQMLSTICSDHVYVGVYSYAKISTTSYYVGSTVSLRRLL